MSNSVGDGMYGLKRVSQCRDDALSRVGWEKLETLLAIHYRGRGYQVDHVGTGGSGARFDGGIDLKLRRDSEYILVQCKHWNAMKVTHNAVHELLGIMVNEGATGAILVTSGEFTKAAIEAGARQGHVQLIDGEELRAMIGATPEPTHVVQAGAPPSDYIAHVTGFGANAADPLLTAAEDRIRYTGRVRSAGGLAKKTGSLLLVNGLGLVFLVAVMLIGWNALKHAILQMQPVAPTQAQPAALPAPAAPVDQAITEMPTSASRNIGNACHEVIDWQSGTYIDHCAKAAPPKVLSAAEQRELQRKADEAIKVLEPNVPEM